jgi:hypothetical protein
MLQPTVQSASPSWNKAPMWGLREDLYYCQTVAGPKTLTGFLYRVGTDPTEISFIRVAYCHSRVFIAPLPSTGCTLLSHVIVRVIQQRAVYQESVFTQTCLSSRCLAVGRYITSMIIKIIILCRPILNKEVVE